MSGQPFRLLSSNCLIPDFILGKKECSEWHVKNTLKVQRAIHNITQDDLAKKVGVTR
jgi:hypothetical protein